MQGSKPTSSNHVTPSWTSVIKSLAGPVHEGASIFATALRSCLGLIASPKSIDLSPSYRSRQIFHDISDKKLVRDCPQIEARYRD